MARPADGHPGLFRLARVDRDRASKLVKRPVGQATSSPSENSVVRRKGLLDEIPPRG